VEQLASHAIGVTVVNQLLTFSASVFVPRTSPRQVARDCRVTLVSLDAPRNDTATSSRAETCATRSRGRPEGAV